MQRRRTFTPEEKVKILREYFEAKKSVADICEEFRLSPKLFYDWKNSFFEKAVDGFSKPVSKKKEHKQIERLETQLKDRNEIIAELLQENIRLKKFNGAR